MTPSKALLSVLQLFAAFSFFASSIFFFSLPFLPKVNLQILLASSQICYKIGLVLMAISLILLGGFYFLSRGRSLTIRMGSNWATISELVIKKSLESRFKNRFKGISLTDLSVLSGSKLSIEIILAPCEENFKEEIFAKIQNEIAPFLAEQFGYTKPFDLIIKNCKL